MVECRCEGMRCMTALVIQRSLSIGQWVVSTLDKKSLLCAQQTQCKRVIQYSAKIDHHLVNLFQAAFALAPA